MDTTTLYFEDFKPGTQLIPGCKRTVTEDDILAFANLSGDRNPIHIDSGVAAQNQFGKIVAHGTLCLAIATGLAWETGLAKRCKEIVFRKIGWTFSGPVFPGDTLELTMEVKAAKHGVVIFVVKLSNQSGFVVSEGDWSFLIPSRAADSATTDQLVETAPPKSRHQRADRMLTHGR